MPSERILSPSITVCLFLEDRISRGFSKSTLRFYRDKLGLFARWCEAQGVADVAAIDSLLVRRYFAHLIDRGNSKGAQNAAGRGVKTFLRWCEAEELTSARPLRNVTIPQPPKQILPAFSREDVARLYAAAPDGRARALVVFMLDTGLRVSEVVALNGGDLDILTGVVNVRNGKGGKSRQVYFSQLSRKHLMHYFKQCGWPGEDEPVWRTQRKGVRLDHQGIRESLAAIGKEAGVRNVRPHQFRRTFATWMLRNGTDLHTLAKLMGHSDIRVLKQYLDLSDDDTAAAHRSAAILDRLLKDAKQPRTALTARALQQVER